MCNFSNRLLSNVPNDGTTTTFSQVRDNGETIDKYFHVKKNSGVSQGDISITGQEIEPVQIRANKTEKKYMSRRIYKQQLGSVETPVGDYFWLFL